MLKRKIFAITIMVCILFVGVAYGKWTDWQNVELETKSGTLEYQVNDIDDCEVILKNSSLEYGVDKGKLELVECDDGMELVILVSEEELKSKMGEESLSGIKVNYGVSGTEKNTIYNVEINDEAKAHKAIITKKEKNTASDGEIVDKTTLNGEITCVSTTLWEAVEKADSKYIKISHETTFDNCYNVEKGDEITFEFEDVILQKTKNEGIVNANTFTTYCLWSQKINLKCKIIIN